MTLCCSVVRRYPLQMSYWRAGRTEPQQRRRRHRKCAHTPECCSGRSSATGIATRYSLSTRHEIELHAADRRAWLRPPSTDGLPGSEGLDPDVAAEKQGLQVCCTHGYAKTGTCTCSCLSWDSCDPHLPESVTFSDRQR